MPPESVKSVVLLPGMMCDERMWRYQIENLPLPSLVPDTRPATSIEEMAALTLEQAPRQFALAGLSMGGIVAFEIWRQAPDRVSHLALLDTNPFAELSERQSLRLEQMDFVLNGGLRELAVESLKPLYLAECNRNNEEILEVLLDMTMELGPEVFRRQSLALRDRVESTNTLDEISCPTLVLCGEEDSLCPVGYHEFMASRIPDARLKILQNCGHLASMEQPARVTDQLCQLFARTGE